MQFGQDIAVETPSGLGRARRMLREQLEALVRLAAIAMRMAETVARVAGEPGKTLARPLAGVLAVEKAVRGYARVSWALRLIAALRAKLLDDLHRVERGEAVDVTPRAEAPRPLAAQAEALLHNRPEAESARETERGETESFGRFLSRRSDAREFTEILKRPTEEVIALIRQALGVSEEEARGGELRGEAPEVSVGHFGGRSAGYVPKVGGSLSGVPPPG